MGGERPWRYVTGMGSALVDAFSTASSSATLPLTIQGTPEENDTATLPAMDPAGIPEAGLVTMVLVLQATGLPVEGVG